MPFLLLLCFNCGHSMKSFIAPSWNWKDLVLEQQLQCNHFKSSEQINFVSWRKRLHYFCDHLQNRQSAGQTQGMGQLTPTWQVHVKVVIAWGKAGYFESKPSKNFIWLYDYLIREHGHLFICHPSGIVKHPCIRQRISWKMRLCTSLLLRFEI